MEKGIYSTRCWIDGGFREATIWFSDGKINAITEGGVLNDNVENFGDALIMAGAIDAHAHVNEPGRTHWEGFDTATQAAAAGGTTTLIDMPLNASPVTTTVAAFGEKLAATQGKMHINLGFYGGIVPQNAGKIADLAQSGVLGIKAFLTHSGIDEFPNVTLEDLEQAMPVLAKLNIPLLAHCELSDDTVQRTPYGEEGLLAENPTNYAAYLASRPKSWENKAVQMMIDLCRKHQCPVHIVHVSSAEALPLIAVAKAEGLPLTAETCSHYLFFNAEEIPNGNTLYKCAPPIREKENNEQLKMALKSGVLDFVTTDHSPAPPEIKEIESGNLKKAWGGISGLQYMVSVAWTSLKETMDLAQFIPLITDNPAQFLGVSDKKGQIKVGLDADFTIWQPEETFIVQKEENRHRHPLSPYNEKELFGRIEATFVGGEKVFHKTIINKNRGQWILKKQ
ncbi:MAG: allantoinase AllB [Saprospiraceae bacterium]|nr:allantoinase AllB [Saprospiraceae bacterium]